MIYQGHKLRHEFKYYINYGTYQILRSRCKDFILTDANMVKEEGYLISSLYFDDVYNSAMEEKIAGTRFRKKFRIRIYERSDTVIKLECKMKYDSFIAKESASLTREEYNLILAGNYEFLLEKKEELCKELYILHRTCLLRPIVVVEYLREAYVLKEGNVRITFDKNISASYDKLDMFSERCAVTEILPEGIMVLEVKYDDYLPTYVMQFLQIGESEKCAVSKYVMCRKKSKIIKHY